MAVMETQTPSPRLPEDLGDLGDPEATTAQWRASANGRLAVATWQRLGAATDEVDALLSTTAPGGLLLDGPNTEVERWAQIRLHAWRATDRAGSAGQQPHQVGVQP
jgi:hypothetical protein